MTALIKRLLDKAREHDDRMDSHQLWSSKDYKRTWSSGFTWATWGVGIDIAYDWRSWGVSAQVGPAWVGYMSQEEL